MSQNFNTRLAKLEDLNELLAMENICFASDRLSKRSFLNFIKSGSHDLLVITNHQQLIGYALILYRAGTNLARLYSIAVLPEFQGKGLSKLMLEAVERAVQERHCVFMRLEVNISNVPAISLYKKYGYYTIDTIKEYYDDGADAYRMEKRMHHLFREKLPAKSYYEQTTDFTCGPSSLMMAMHTLNPDYQMTRREEVQIWREATTIFMTAGHGGCSPYGLALSAWRRGFDVTLHINQSVAPFLDGVRGEEKKAVIQLVHDDFLSQIKDTNIKLKIHTMEAEELNTIVNSGLPILALISTWRLNRNKAPHWIYVAGSEEEFVFINDPDIGDDPHATQADNIQVPIAKNMFSEMARFGQKRLRSLLVISHSKTVNQ